MHLYRKTKEESGKGLNEERRKDIKLTFVGSATPSGPILSGDKESAYLASNVDVAALQGGADETDSDIRKLYSNRARCLCAPPVTRLRQRNVDTNRRLDSRCQLFIKTRGSAAL